MHGHGVPLNQTAYAVVSYTDNFRIANRYGLFAHMTTERNEIIVEGSDDGETWFLRVLVETRRARSETRLVQPFQPRLDWQMWFAALRPDAPAWFKNLAYRLLEGKPEVLALLKSNPFPDAPPRYVRAQLYRYRFTTPEEYARNGRWWVRAYLGEYPPSGAGPSSLKK